MVWLNSSTSMTSKLEYNNVGHSKYLWNKGQMNVCTCKYCNQLNI